MFEKIFVTLVGFFRRGETGEHAHCPKLAAITCGVNAARVGRLTGIAEILIVIPVGGKIGLGIETPDWSVGDGAETSLAVFAEVSACGGADWFFGSLLKGGRQSFLGPV